MRTAIYPGSFDPVTLGHIDVIRRASKLFDRLVVCVVVNRNKEALFSVDERVELIKASLEKLGLSESGGVVVISHDGLLVDIASEQKVVSVIKGLRGIADFESESQMFGINQMIDEGFESLFLMTRSEYSHISSSMVKELASYGADLSELVTENVNVALKEKYIE